jgi:hypothetical protein
VAQRDDARQNIRAGTPYPLWPDPTSVYARLETETGFAPGIGFCKDHAPALGQRVLPDFGPVVGLDFARGRYVDWFRTGREAFYRAWLRDAMSLEDPQINRLMEQWQSDRG